MSDVWTFKDLTTAPKKVLKGHEKAMKHFAENLPKDYKNYTPPKGYRHKRYHNPKGHQLPRVGSEVSLKGEFVTVLAKDKAQFVDFSRTDKVVNVLFVSWGKDPNTKTQARFTWENFDKQTGFIRREADADTNNKD
jgi:hypothetical protein